MSKYTIFYETLSNLPMKIPVADTWKTFHDIGTHSYVGNLKVEYAKSLGIVDIVSKDTFDNELFFDSEESKIKFIMLHME